MSQFNPMDHAIDYLLDTAGKQKMDLEILGFERSSTAISFQKSKMDQFSLSETRQLGVRLIDGKHEGVAYTEALDSDSLDQLLTEARNNARAIRREWIADLHTSANLPEMNGLFSEALEKTTVEEKISSAAKLESAALAFDHRISGVAYSTYGDSRLRQWIANSKGLNGSFATNSCYAYTYCMAKDGDNTVMDGEYHTRRGFDSLDTEQLAKEAARKTVARIGSVRPQTGRYTVVFDTHVAASLVGLITSYFSAKAVDEKTSPLSGKYGEKVFSKELSIIDDPFDLRAWGARPFDDEGYASKKTTLVENGVVKSFLTNSVLARKMDLPHTASAARSPSSDLDVSASSILVTPGKSTLQDLLAADAKVIYVTDISGMAGFRAASGDFSLPIMGDLYENGKRSAPLKDFLMSGNILQLFSMIESVGSEVMPPRGKTVCPALLVRDLNISGQA